MKLTNALLPSSSGVKSGLKGECFSKPDAHGGYELGTWDIGFYKLMHEIIGEDYLKDRDSESDAYTVCVVHRFTQDECLRVQQRLKFFLPEIDKKGHKGWIHDMGTLGIFGIKEVWFEHLLQLFSNPNDLPVHYLAD